ncbi:MAG: dihydrofolate reductase [Saprospiraceae bacterium]|nr:dihydrofolate reductase [Saprospiraceae bacterium]
MTVTAIVAVAKNNVIGHHNQIPWYLPADLKYFKKITSGHHVIMGRKSYQSIGRPLPNRTNVVISRDPFFVSSGCLVVRDVEEALDLCYENEESEAFIIGGGEIYKQTLPYWDKVYLTEVDVEVKGDTYFPELSDEWLLESAEHHLPDEKNEYAYTFKLYVRKC